MSYETHALEETLRDHRERVHSSKFTIITRLEFEAKRLSETYVKPY